MLQSFLACYGASAWPHKEGGIWWSVSPSNIARLAESSSQGGKFNPISDRVLHDWLLDTVGWHSIEISPEALQSAEAQSDHVRPLVLASLEAAAACGTKRCRIFRVDVDAGIAKCLCLGPEALQSAGALSDHIMPIVLASLEAAAACGKKRCRIFRVDVDAGIAKCLCLGMAAYSNLQVLVLCELNVHDEGIAQLATGLKESEHLSKLSLHTVDISDSGWEALASALKVNRSIKKFKCRNSLGRSGVSALCLALKDAQHLQELDVSKHALQNLGMVRICKALLTNTSVTTFISSSNHFGAAAATAVANLSNNFGAAAATAVANLLMKNRALTHLDLSHNMSIGSEGCSSIAKALLSNHALKTLNLDFTDIDDVALDLMWCAGAAPSGEGVGFGVLGLVPVVKRGFLRELKLSGNCMIGTEGACALLPLLSPAVKNLTVLALADCEICDKATFELGAVLKSNTSLSHLDLSSNHLTQRGIAMFIEVLKAGSALRELDLSFNWVGPKGMSTCLEELQRAVEVLETHGVVLKEGRRDRGRHYNAALMCKIKTELSMDFRAIESIKNGNWNAEDVADPNSSHREIESIKNGNWNAEDVADPNSSHRSSQDPLSPPGPFAKRLSPRHSATGSLRPGRMLLPAMLLSQRDLPPWSGSASSGGSSGGASGKGHSGAISRVAVHSRGAARATAEDMVQCEELVDGTFNLQLPVSFMELPVSFSAEGSSPSGQVCPTKGEVDEGNDSQGGIGFSSHSSPAVHFQSRLAYQPSRSLCMRGSGGSNGLSYRLSLGGTPNDSPTHHSAASANQEAFPQSRMSQTTRSHLSSSAGGAPCETRMGMVPDLHHSHADHLPTVISAQSTRMGIDTNLNHCNADELPPGISHTNQLPPSTSVQPSRMGMDPDLHHSHTDLLPQGISAQSTRIGIDPDLHHSHTDLLPQGISAQSTRIGIDPDLHHSHTDQLPQGISAQSTRMGIDPDLHHSNADELPPSTLHTDQLPQGISAQSTKMGIDTNLHHSNADELPPGISHPDQLPQGTSAQSTRMGIDTDLHHSNNDELPPVISAQSTRMGIYPDLHHSNADELPPIISNTDQLPPSISQAHEVSQDHSTCKEEQPGCTQEPLTEELPGCTQERSIEEQPGCTQELLIEELRGCKQERSIKEQPGCAQELLIEELPGCTQERSIKEQPGCAQELLIEELSGCTQERSIKEHPGCTQEPLIEELPGCTQ
eukprot:gene28443-31586_t